MKHSYKNSIRHQLLVMFLSLIVLILLLIFIINSSFLEQYYILHKQTQMKEMYQMIENAVMQDVIGTSDMQTQLLGNCERTNISIIVLQVEQDQQAEVILYTEQQERGPLFTKLFGYLAGPKRGTLLYQEDNYAIYKSGEPGTKGDYLEMYGTISDNMLFFMQSPLESIRDSAALANNFLIYVGIAALILGSLFVWFFSKKITEPILELAALSRRMADLDFDARYTGKGDDEIGVLGQSFNTMSEKLEKTISELKKANIRLQKDIEQKQKMEEMRNEFLGNVSHELKTPIALIQGYAEGLKEAVNDDPESREFYCDVIMDEAGKMNQMVKNLLVLNQLEFGSDEVSMNRFDVVKLIRGVIASCEILIRQAEADVDFIADETAYVWADEFKTEQVIRNYLTNAIHHAAGEKRIEIRVIPQENTVRISVFNTGTPIPEEDIGRIWDKFYKVDKAHTREYGGNGIGLSIVKAIMESFHQNYGVQNYQNGVEFWCELDAKSMAAPAVTVDAEEFRNEI